MISGRYWLCSYTFEIKTIIANNLRQQIPLDTNDNNISNMNHILNKTANMVEPGGISKKDCDMFFVLAIEMLCFFMQVLLYKYIWFVQSDVVAAIIQISKKYYIDMFERFP